MIFGTKNNLKANISLRLWKSKIEKFVTLLSVYNLYEIKYVALFLYNLYFSSVGNTPAGVTVQFLTSMNMSLSSQLCWQVDKVTWQPITITYQVGAVDTNLTNSSHSNNIYQHELNSRRHEILGDEIISIDSIQVKVILIKFN